MTADSLAIDGKVTPLADVLRVRDAPSFVLATDFGLALDLRDGSIVSIATSRRDRAVHETVRQALTDAVSRAAATKASAA